MKKCLWGLLIAFAVVAATFTSGTMVADESPGGVQVVQDEQFDALIQAVRRNNHEDVLALLQAGVNPNQLGRGGLTPLHYALRPRADKADAYGVVALLLDYGADPSLEDHRGMTPLLLATLSPQGSQAIVERLIEAGADPNQVMPTNGFAILTMARMLGNDGASVAIRDAGGVIGSSQAENMLGDNIDKLGEFSKTVRRMQTRRRASSDPPTAQEWEQRVVDAAQEHLDIPDGEPALGRFRERVRARIEMQKGCGSCDANK